ncbi:hypothetical protein ACFE04_027876 [Oxalis oulophora]
MKNPPPAAATAATTSTVTVPTKKRTRKTKKTTTATTATTAATAIAATAIAATATVPTRKRTKKITSATATATAATTTAPRSFARSSGPTIMEVVRNNYNDHIPSRHTRDPSVLTSKSGPPLFSPTRSIQLGISLMKKQMARDDDFDDIDDINIDHQTNFANFDGILLLQSLAYSESQLVKCVVTI